MEKKTPLRAITVLTLLVLITFELSSTALVKANGFPPSANTRIEIDTPKNKTYTNNSIILSFHVWQTYKGFSFFYSVDGRDLKLVENITTTDEFNLNAGKNPEIIVANLRCSCILASLSEGRHNVTVYQVGDYPAANPQNGEIIRSATTEFIIAKEPELLQQESFPTTLVIAPIASVAIIGSGLLIYFKKRKR